MPNNPPLWENERYPGSERHEIFEGNGGNRKKSIEDGLVIFISPEMHRTGKHSIHKSPKEWLFLKKLGQQIYMKHYSKTAEEFRQRYYKNYL